MVKEMSDEEGKKEILVIILREKREKRSIESMS